MITSLVLVEDKSETEILKEIEGLGTEATRSGIIETIKRHGYISVTKNIVSITDKARILCQAIEGNLLASPLDDCQFEVYREIKRGCSDILVLLNLEKGLKHIGF